MIMAMWTRLNWDRNGNNGVNKEQHFFHSISNFLISWVVNKLLMQELVQESQTDVRIKFGFSATSTISTEIIPTTEKEHSYPKYTLATLSNCLRKSLTIGYAQWPSCSLRWSKATARWVIACRNADSTLWNIHMLFCELYDRLIAPSALLLASLQTTETEPRKLHICTPYTTNAQTRQSKSTTICRKCKLNYPLLQRVLYSGSQAFFSYPRRIFSRDKSHVEIASVTISSLTNLR